MENLVEEAMRAYGGGKSVEDAGCHGPSPDRNLNRLVSLPEHRATRVAPAMALTDINNSTGIMEFVAVCKEKGIKPIAGIEFRRGDQLLYTGLAKNNDGFRELNEFLSEHNLKSQPLPDQAPEFDNVFVIYPFSHTSIITRKSSLENRQSSIVNRQSICQSSIVNRQSLS